MFFSPQLWLVCGSDLNEPLQKNDQSATRIYRNSSDSEEKVSTEPEYEKHFSFFFLAEITITSFCLAKR